MIVNELRIYQSACQLRDELHGRLNRLPHSWSIKSVDQAQRSSSSVSANIAEGYAKRFYRKDFVRYLYISLGSCDETQDHIRALFADNHLNPADAEYFQKRYKDLSIRIVNYINYQRKKFLTE
jgi:four helix bundle protein